MTASGAIRYKPWIDNSGNHHMEAAKDGIWVRASAYDALLAQVEALREALAAAQARVSTLERVSIADHATIMALETANKALRIECGTLGRTMLICKQREAALRAALEMLAAQTSGVPGSTVKADCMAAIAMQALAAYDAKRCSRHDAR